MKASVNHRIWTHVNAAVFAMSVAIMCCCMVPSLAHAAQVDINDEAYAYFDSAYYSTEPVIPEHEVYYYDDNAARHDLVEGVDYRIEYKNNIEIGTATATVYGIGSYTGSISVNFNIWARPLSDEEIVADPIEGLVYTGAAQMPKPTLRIGSYTLVEGVDYRIMAYFGNVNAGTAYIDCDGLGKFASSKTISFTIDRAPLSSVKFDAIPTQTYTSLNIEPRITGTYNDTELTFSDYTCTYAKNRTVGTAKAIVTGNYNFEGQKTLTFKIKKGKNRLSVKAVKKNLTVKRKNVKMSSYFISSLQLINVKKWDGFLSYKKASATASGKAKRYAKKIKVSKATGSVTMPKSAAKGTYTVKIKVMAKDTIRKNASKTLTFKIKVK